VDPRRREVFDKRALELLATITLTEKGTAGSERTAHQYPIGSFPESLHQSNQYLHSWPQFPTFYLGKLTLTNP
jgi:hypothetical protein